MDVPWTTEPSPETVMTSILVEDACPRCSSTRTTLVLCGWTVRITRCRACSHEWIARRDDSRSESNPIAA
jgi:hypothetical protein